MKLFYELETALSTGVAELSKEMALSQDLEIINWSEEDIPKSEISVLGGRVIEAREQRHPFLRAPSSFHHRRMPVLNEDF